MLHGSSPWPAHPRCANPQRSPLSHRSRRDTSLTACTLRQHQIQQRSAGAQDHARAGGSGQHSIGDFAAHGGVLGGEVAVDPSEHRGTSGQDAGAPGASGARVLRAPREMMERGFVGPPQGGAETSTMTRSGAGRRQPRAGYASARSAVRFHRIPASMKASRSPSRTAAVLPTS